MWERTVWDSTVWESLEVEIEEVDRAVAAVRASATELGLATSDVVLLHNSNKLALRLLPCDVVARVARIGHEVAAFEVDVVRQLADTGAPVAALAAGVAPQVYHRDGFAITWWTHHEEVIDGALSPAAYGAGLADLHAGMRQVTVTAPHVLGRVDEAEQLLADRDRTPELDAAGRCLLVDTLDSVRRTLDGSAAAEQLLHGEPHRGNVLDASSGLRFIDFETCCLGPVEFDVAHAPLDVAAHYGDLDGGLLSECRRLVLAMVATWRWDTNDEFPDRLRHGRTILDLLAAGPPWPALGDLSDP